MKIQANQSEYKAERDEHGWTLFSPITVKDKKTKELKPGWRPTYYASFTQVCDAILDREIGKLDHLEDIKQMISDFHNHIQTNYSKVAA